MYEKTSNTNNPKRIRQITYGANHQYRKNKP